MSANAFTSDGLDKDLDFPMVLFFLRSFSVVLPDDAEDSVFKVLEAWTDDDTEADGLDTGKEFFFRDVDLPLLR